MLMHREGYAQEDTEQSDAARVVHTKEEREHGSARGCHASTPDARLCGRHRHDALHDTLEVRRDVMLGDAEHVPPQGAELVLKVAR